MPSSPGMNRFGGEIAPADDSIANCGRVEPFALSAEFQGVPQLDHALAVCATRAQNCAPPSAREDCLLRSPPMKTVLRKRRRRRGGKRGSSGAHRRVEVGGSDREHPGRLRGSGLRAARPWKVDGESRHEAARRRASRRRTAITSIKACGILCHRAFLNSTASSARIACSMRSNATPATSPACSLSSPWLDE